MPQYIVTDPQTGVKLRLTGDSPPTEQELEAAFANVKQPEQERAAEDPRRVAGDIALNIATSAIAEPIAGAAGFGAQLGEALGMADEGTAADTVRSVRDSLTREPRTRGAKDFFKAAGEAVQGALTSDADISRLSPVGAITPSISPRDIVESTQQFQDKVLETAGPLAATVTGTLPVAIAEILGFKGLRSAKKAALKAEVEGNPAQVVRDGELTQEFIQALDEQGIKPEEIVNFDPQQVDRLERFSDFGATPTQGELSRDFPTIKQEQALLETATDESGRGMQAFKAEQSKNIRLAVDNKVDQLGLPNEAAASVKEALSSRKQSLKNKKNKLYKQLAQASQEADIPILTDNLLSGLPDKGQIRTISALNKDKATALNELLAEFGIAGEPPKGVDVTPLSLANQEGFRIRLNSIIDSDPSGQMNVIIGPIKRALDEEVASAANILERSGNPNVAILAKEARQANIDLKTEFDEKSIVDKLVSNKKRSRLAAIEDSQVYNKLTAKSLPVEEVQRVVDSLSAAGAKGSKALGNLQSAMFLDLIDSAYSATTRKINDVPIFGGTAFQRRYETLKPKLDIVFKDNPEALKQIDNLNRVAIDLTPPDAAKLKGSSGFLIDILQKPTIARITGLIPGGTATSEGLIVLGRRAKNREILEKALKAKPELNNSAKSIANDYPGLALALGIGYLATGDNNE